MALHAQKSRHACYCAAAAVPFGGYKDSGIGREKGEYALGNYTQVCAQHDHTVQQC